MRNFIKALILFSLFGAVSSSAGCFAQQKTGEKFEKPVDSAQRVSVLDGQVSFVPPSGFHQTTVEQLKYRLADNFPPLLLLTDSEQNGYIAITQDASLDFKPEHLVYIKGFLERQYRSSTLFISVSSELVIKDKRQWLIFNCEERERSELELLKAPTPEGQEPERIYDESPVHSRDYSTTINGKLITLNFVSPVKNYPQLEKEFDRSIQSIQVKY